MNKNFFHIGYHNIKRYGKDCHYFRIDVDGRGHDCVFIGPLTSEVVTKSLKELNDFINNPDKTIDRQKRFFPVEIK